MSTRIPPNVVVRVLRAVGVMCGGGAWHPARPTGRVSGSARVGSKESRPV